MAVQVKTLKRKVPGTSENAVADAEIATTEHEAEESIEKELMDVDWNVGPAAILFSPYTESSSTPCCHDAAT